MKKLFFLLFLFIPSFCWGIQDSVIRPTNTTASRLVSTDTDKKLISVTNLCNWVYGTALQIVCTDNLDGTLTLDFPDVVAMTTSLTVPLIYGSTASGGGLEFHSTSHATKGTINIADTLYVDEVNKKLDVAGNIKLTGDLQLYSGATKLGELTNDYSSGIYLKPEAGEIAGIVYSGATKIWYTASVDINSLNATQNQFGVNMDTNLIIKNTLGAISGGSGSIQVATKSKMKVVLDSSQNKTFQGLSTEAVLDVSTTGGITGNLVGLFSYAANNSSVNVAEIYGVDGLAANTLSGNVTNLYGLYFPTANTGTGTITNLYGIRVPNAINSGGGTINTAYGLYLDQQTNASTNYTIYSSGGENVLNAGTATEIPLTVKGAAAQTASLFQMQDSAGNIIHEFNLAGATDPTVYFNKQAGDIDLVAATDNVATAFKVDAGTDIVQTNTGRQKKTTRIEVGATPYTVLATDHIIYCDTDGGAIEIDLPAGTDGREFRIINVGSSGNDCTVDPNGVEQLFAGGAGVAFALHDTERILINYQSTEGWW